MADFSREVATLQEALGLPTEPLFEGRLLYCRQTSTVIFCCTLNVSGCPIGRIFVRGLNDARYAEAVQVHDGVSLSSALLCESAALFAVKYRWSVDRRSDGGASGDYEGLIRIDLKNGTSEVWNTETTLAERFFVSQICGVSADGNLIHAVAGQCSPNHVGPVTYALVAFDWTTRSARVVGDLPHIFF
jgi:hypothetical protein